MNRYGRMAFDHARHHRPAAFAALNNPTAFFTTLGEEAASEISRLRDELTGQQLQEETVEGDRRRSYQAQCTAEELVLAEAVWLPAETNTMEPEDEDVLAYRARLAGLSKTLAATDHTWTETEVEAITPP